MLKVSEDAGWSIASKFSNSFHNLLFAFIRIKSSMPENKKMALILNYI